VVRYSMVKVVN